MEFSFHKPVMLKEVIDSLNCRPGGIYLDGTVGGGGHSYHILKKTAPDGMLIGIDTDDDALSESERTLESFAKRKVIVKGNFADIGRILDDLNIEKVDGILFDLGVSSHQLETAERGFSFSLDAPLDMRMDRRQELCAYDLINTLSDKKLEGIIRKYGEEIMAGRIVKAISAKRKISPIKSTKELATIIVEALPPQLKRKRTHPATKTFQALRITVNDELSNLYRAINDGIDVLKEGGRFSIISFHSLEDRIVKNLFRSWEKGCICPPDFPVCACKRKPKLKVLTRRPIMPGDVEINANPRARSARLRTTMRV
ncbi:MAG: 16S rRNA (cytosine(1402)-N(4))-methyltransferase RsmH [Thermodesulfobacteriota bacterium]|nr:16S rRNA (cytosine(1402)-N(4))-methyltransferase RsmH [Thermodesulfobacteriota bacterium]